MSLDGPGVRAIEKADGVGGQLFGVADRSRRYPFITPASAPSAFRSHSMGPRTVSAPPRTHPSSRSPDQHDPAPSEAGPGVLTITEKTDGVGGRLFGIIPIIHAGMPSSHRLCAERLPQRTQRIV